MTDPLPDRAPLPSDLALRVGVGIALVALAGAALWAGDILFWFVATAAAVLMLYEWGQLHRATIRSVRAAQLLVFVALFMLIRWDAAIGYPGIGVMLIVAGVIWLATRDRALAVGALYVGLPVLGLLILREAGLVYAFWAMALVWATDIGAYFGGRALGGPKLAPVISPNKTWAGFVAGAVAATLFGLILSTFAGLPVALVAATPLLSMLSQGGDLYESWLKRQAGVKDSGSLLPGHGGVLDRLDGLVPVAPVAALIVLMLGISGA